VTAKKAARARKGSKKHRRRHAAPTTSHRGPPPPDVVAAAQKVERETGIPTSVTLGQWSLESGYGAHSPGNNPFGIKARAGQPYQLLWTHEQTSSGLVRVQQKFRTFDSLDQAFEARGELLSKHYPVAMAHTDDPDAFAAGLQAQAHHKYATDSDYVAKLVGRMKQNNYYQYDLKNAKAAPAASDATTKKNNDASVRLTDGEPTVLLGTDHHMAAHVESPHTGGGKIVEGSSTVFVGPRMLAFAREGDTTNDSYQVTSDVQENVLVG
jgi:hypothetical protein